MEGKKCSTCGGNDHQRSSSKKCIAYQPRQGAEIPEETEEQITNNEGLKKEVVVYKQGLNTFTNHRFNNGETLIERIQSQVAAVTKNSYYASRILNYHLQKCVENGTELPDITNRTWLRQLFTRVIKDNDLQESIDEIDHLLPELQTGIIPQITTLCCKDYAVNAQVHLDIVYHKINRKWMKAYFDSKGLKKKEVTALVGSIMDDPQSFENSFPNLVTPYLVGQITVGSRIKRMYDLNKLFGHFKTKLYNLAPQYTTNAKYITIDTDVLYSLVKSDLKVKKIKEFGAIREDQWRKYTNVKEKYFKDNKRFNCRIKTDGVACSIELFTWISIPKSALSEEKKAQNKQVKAQVERELLDRLAHTDKLRIVGCDPGRKDLLSAVDTNNKKFVLSNKKYYKDCKFKERQQWKLEQLRKLRILPFMLQTPTNKTADSERTIEYLQYLADHETELELLFKLELESRTKHKRWRSYIHKQKTLDKFCNELIDGQKANTLFAYGDASFNHNSKGYAPSLKGNWIRHQLQKVHGCNLVMIREYNTSQVCSACHHNEKLVSVGSLRDTKRFDFPLSAPPVKPHFVRRCTHCLMIW